MQRDEFSQRIKMVLKAFGFTPSILARIFGISTYRARQLLSPTGIIYMSDVISITTLFRNMNYELLTEGAKALERRV